MPRQGIAAAEACGKGLSLHWPLEEVKPLPREAAWEVRDPVAAAVQTPTNALGFLFYGAAACRQASLSQPAQVYDGLADGELCTALASLERWAVAQEPHPARLRRNCCA